MKFNMKDWKKVGDHPEHVQMRNADGHELMIAKKALSSEVLKHMTELPIHRDGGGGIPGGSGSPAYSATGPVSGLKKPGDEDTSPKSVSEQVSQGVENIKKYFSSDDKSNKAKGGMIKNYADGGVANSDSVNDSPEQIAADAQPAPQVNVNVGSQPMPPGQSYGMPTANGMAWTPQPYQQPMPLSTPSPEQDPTGMGQAYATMFNKQREQAPVAPSPEAQQAGKPQSNLPPPVTGAQGADSSGGGSDQMSDYAKTALGGVNQQMLGYKQEADAAKELGEAIAPQENEAAQLSNQSAMSYKETQDGVARHQQELADAIQQGQIKPVHMFDNMNTGQKILATIGLMFTGAGSALSHRPDSGMAYLNQLMDNDLKAQAANQSNRLSLFQHYNDVFKNNTDAQLMTRTLQNDYLDHVINEAKAKNMDPMAQARMNQLQGQLRQQTAMLRSMIGTNGGPGGKMDPVPQQIQMYRMMGRKDLADDMQAKYVPEAPGQLAKVPVDAETRNTIMSRKLLDDNIAQLQAFSQKYGGSLQGIVDPRVKAQGEALARQVQDQYRRGNQQGVFKPAEAEFVNGVIADDPSSLFAKFTKLPAYQAAKAINRGALAAEFAKVGLVPPKAVTNQAPQGFVPKTARPIGK